ncbi:glycoside hydrolase family 104 protein [Enterobacter ludwigii]
MNTSFPACQKNGQPYPGVDQMMDVLLREPHGSWLAGTNTLWHGGVHLSGVSAPGSVLTPETADSAVPLRFMADGEVVAWRLNQGYLSGDYMGNALQYSGTFVLVKSTCTPDPEKPDNALDFYALYMGLAPLSAFPVHQLYQVTERGNKLRKRHHTGQEKPGEQAPVPDGGHLATGDRVVVLRENSFELNGVSQRFGLARMLNSKSEMHGAAFWVSLDPVFMTPDGEQRAHLPAWMQQAIAQGAYDAVVTPASKCIVAAGDAVGYLAEDIAPDGMHGVEKSAFVHIELLSTDSRMRDFLNNTAQVKRGQTYIHIHPESFLYERSGDTFTRTTGKVKKDIHQILPQDKCYPFTDSSGKRWFTLGEGAWLSESDVDADIAQYDLMKLGFSAFEEPPTSDMTQSLHEGWVKSAFTQLAEWVRPERGIQEQQVSTWYKALLRKMDSDSSGDLSGAELYHAVHFPEMDVRDIAARMVVKHDSEWFGGSQHHRWKTFLQRTDPLYVSYVRQWFDDLEWMSQVPEFSSGEPVWHMHPVVFLDAVKNISVISLEEARVRAFMRMLRVGEGTLGDKGYETLFGGQSFIKDYHKDFSDHPRISITRGKLTSSAAGAYQIMGYSWDDPQMVRARTKYGVSDFTPLSQDKCCVLILKIKRKGSLDMIANGDINGALDVLSYEWASLPPGRYGQPAKTRDEANKLFDGYLKEELKGKTDLYLPIGYISKCLTVK